MFVLRYQEESKHFTTWEWHKILQYGKVSKILYHFKIYQVFIVYFYILAIPVWSFIRNWKIFYQLCTTVKFHSCITFLLYFCTVCSFCSVLLTINHKCNFRKIDDTNVYICTCCGKWYILFSRKIDTVNIQLLAHSILWKEF